MALTYTLINTEDHGELLETIETETRDGSRVVGYSAVFITNGRAGVVKHYALVEKNTSPSIA